MPAYNFKRRFHKMVESGEKTQTIRKVRKYPTKPGQVIYLNVGMRTKHFRRLGFGMIESVVPFVLQFVDFFKTHYRIPFEGEIIKWRLLDGQ